MALIDKLTNIANAIREKTGSTDKMTLDGMAEAIAGIEAGGGNSGGGECDREHFEDVVDSKNFLLTGVVDNIPEDGFADVSGITHIKFNHLHEIKAGGFARCHGLKEADIVNCVYFGNYAFFNCDSLTKVHAPYMHTIGESAYASCFELKTIGHSDASISDGLINVKGIEKSAFVECEKFLIDRLPGCYYIEEYAFKGCKSIEKLMLPNVFRIDADAFTNCINLKALVISNRGTVCDIAVSAVIGTKIIDITGTPTGEGFIYVPTSLYESYISDLVPKIVAFATANGVPIDEPTATYMATAILRKLEDYTVDGTVNGELDESKI